MFFQAIRDKQRAVKRATSPDTMDVIVQRALKPLAGDMSELNRDQLKIGMRADGTFLPPYSKASVEKFGKKPGTIKLKDRGFFYDGITPEFAKRGFTMEGKDEKTDWLQFGTGYGAHPDGFGEEILGLSEFGVKEISRDAIGQIQFELKKEIDK